MCMAIMAEKKPKELFRYLAQQGGDINAYVPSPPLAFDLLLSFVSPLQLQHLFSSPGSVDPVLGTPLIMALRDMAPRLKVCPLKSRP